MDHSFYGGNNIWIGLDDTDSKEHGCTTYLINYLKSEFKEYMFSEYPYLVRLNPNIPWKTRGNGAVCIQLKNNGEPISEDFDNALVRTEKIITNHASLEDKTTNPGIVVTDDLGLPIDIYWSAVTNVVKLKNVQKYLDRSGTRYKKFKSGRGIIGASAAVAWASNSLKNNKKNNLKTQDHTFEIITYRKPNNWGTERMVDNEAVKLLDSKFPTTFNNYDLSNNNNIITPNSPCPVLFGIRGDDPDDLKAALDFMKPNCEPVETWLLFKTNQGSDDHLVETKLSDINPYTSVITTGRVSTKARTITGGHVFFELEDVSKPQSNGNDLKKDRSTITCAAYEPTKKFREIPLALLPGDLITVYGGVRNKPITINIEKIEIINLGFEKIKSENPTCFKCGKKMKSIGMGQGFRCRACHQKVSYSQATFIKPARKLQLGLYEVPVSARRHLSKPLKRFRNITG